MSGDKTPNLELEYLAPSQAQPEVIINDAWNKIDAAAGITIEDAHSPHTIVTGVRVLRVAGASIEAESDGAALLTVEGSAASTAAPGGAISIEGLDESPHVTIHDAELLRVSGASVEQLTDGSVLMTITPGSSLEVSGEGDSPRVNVLDVTAIRFAGPVSVAEQSNGDALVTIDGREFVLAAVWNSSTSAVPIALAVPQDLMLARAATLEGVYIQTQGPAGSCTVSLFSAAFPFVSGADITGGASPAIASGTSYSNAALTGWTLAFAQGAIIRASLAANTNFTSVKIFLRFK
jgi:hypothetical protein